MRWLLTKPVRRQTGPFDRNWRKTSSALANDGGAAKNFKVKKLQIMSYGVSSPRPSGPEWSAITARPGRYNGSMRSGCEPCWARGARATYTTVLVLLQWLVYVAPKNNNRPHYGNFWFKVDCNCLFLLSSYDKYGSISWQEYMKLYHNIVH